MMAPDAMVAPLAIWSDVAEVELKYMIEDGDKVVTFAQRVAADGTPMCVLVDMFRVEAGKLVEHWDVAQRATDPPFRHGSLL